MLHILVQWFLTGLARPLPQGPSINFQGQASPYTPYNMESLILKFSYKSYCFTACLKTGGSLKQRIITEGRRGRKKVKNHCSYYLWFGMGRRGSWFWLQLFEIRAPSPKRQIVFLTTACRFDSSPSVSCREELTKARNILESLSVGDDPVLAQKLIDVDRDCMNMARELEDSKSKVRTYRLGDDRGRFSSGNISLCMLNLNAGRNFGLLHSTNDCLQAFTTQRLMFRPR